MVGISSYLMSNLGHYNSRCEHDSFNCLFNSLLFLWSFQTKKDLNCSCHLVKIYLIY